MKKRLLPITILAALGLAALAGCGNGGEGGGGGGETTVDVTGVTLNKSSVTIEEGKTETLVATVAPSDATNKNVTWKSSKTSIATVADGVVSAVSMGETTITVTTEDGGKTATCNVVVSAALTALSITNKAAFEGMKEGENKSISFSTTPAKNPDLVGKYVVLTSSDETIATTTGTTVYAKKSGKTTITASLWGVSDSFELTVEEVPVVEVDYGTAESPLTISEALVEVAKLELDNKAYSAEPFFVKASLKSSMTPASQSGFGFSIKEESGESPKSLDVSSCLLEEGKKAEDYAIGDIITITGYLRRQSDKTNGYYFSYNNKVDPNVAPQIIKWEKGEGGEEVPEPEVTDRSLADFIAGENTKAVAYYVSGEIKAFKDGATKDEYGNMTLTDGTNDLTIYGSTVTESALVWNKADAYAFTNPKDFLKEETTNALKLGDTVKMKLIRDDFNTTIEGKGVIVDVTPGEGGEEVPEPEVKDRSLADFIAGENVKTVAYYVSGEIKAFKDGATKDKYGNMTLTDGTNELVIYGSTATATALEWNKVDAYAFKNPQDFLENKVTSALKVGDTVKMKLIREDFNTTVQGKGVIVDVTPGEGGGGEEGPDYLSVVESPEVGVKYKLGMKVSARGDDGDVFLTGAKSGNFGATSSLFSEGVDAELVLASSGKYNVKLTYSDESVKYLNCVVDRDYTNISFDESANTEYEYNAEAHTLFFEANGHTTSAKDGEYYFGTYGTYTTVSCSETSRITGDNASKVDAATGGQFPIHFCVKGEAPKAPDLERIDISASKSEVNLYGLSENPTVQFSASPYPAKAELGELTWSSSDKAVTVSETGLVTIPVSYVAEGESKSFDISASNGTISSEAVTITVINSDVAPVKLDNIDLSVLTSKDSNLGGNEITEKSKILKALNSNSISDITSMSKVYAGNPDQGPKITGLKLGTGSAPGTIVFKLAAAVSSIKLTCRAWNSSKLAEVTVNGVKVNLVAADASADRVVEFSFAETDSLSISSSMYALFTLIAF